MELTPNRLDMTLPADYMALLPNGEWPAGYFHFDKGVWKRKIDGGAFPRAYTEASKHDIRPDDLVIDFGACIGGFASRAVEMGAEAVAIEAHPETHALLKLNVNKAHCVWGAVCSGAGETIPLYLRRWGVCSNTHGIRPAKNREVIAVPAIDFRSIMLSRQPDVIKMDIEGGEYTLDWSWLNLWRPRIMQIEHHVMSGGMRTKAIELMDTILAAGYSRTSQTPDFERVMAVITYARNI